jgi:solute carrier family 25 phosphate transporter 3
VVDDAKDKANALSAEAAKEFEKASAKAQAKTGHIELYSAQYYAACTFGGLLACVSRCSCSCLTFLHE